MTSTTQGRPASSRATSGRAQRRLRAGLIAGLPAAALLLTLAAGSWPAAGSSTSAVEPTARLVALRPPAAPAALPAPHLVVLGDSVPSGAGCGCTSFGSLLARDLADTAGRPTTLTNAAQDGLTTAGLLSQVRSGSLDGRLRAATAVTVTIGANDFDPAYAQTPDCGGSSNLACFQPDLAAMSSSLSAVLAELSARTPSSATVIVTGYWNVFLAGAVGAQQGPTYVHISDALTRAVNGRIAAAAAAAKDRYGDLYTPFARVSPAALTALLAPDGDHPSAAGHQLIARTLLPGLTGS